MMLSIMYCLTCRDTNDLLWWSIVGNTEMYLSCKIEDDRSIHYVTTQIDHAAD